MVELSLGIAIPSFNQAAFVRQTLMSLKALATPFQAIIRDAGSTDGSLAIIEDLVAGDDRFRLDVQPDRGQSDAINQAWEQLLPEHPLVTWVNTDDLLYPAYDELVAWTIGKPAVVAAYGDFDIISASGAHLGSVRRPGRVRRSMLLHYYNAMPGLGMVIRSDAIAAAGALDTSLRYAMDFELWLRLSFYGQLRRYPACVAAFRWHEAAKTAGKPDQSAQEERAVRMAHGATGKRTDALTRIAWRGAGRAMRFLGPWREVHLGLVR